MLIECTCADERASDTLRFSMFEVAAVPRVGDWIDRPDGLFRVVNVAHYVGAPGQLPEPVARVALVFAP
jgi:hypothetical protein